MRVILVCRVAQYISEEGAAGRIVGPLGLAGIHCSPIGLVPKGGGTGKWRMIVDLSYPAGRSVNDGIVSDLCSLWYTSVDVALQFINSLGWSTVLIKVDLKNAYHMVPIHPADRHLFGIRWDGNVYMDHVLPFGLRSALKLFTAAIGYALTQAGIQPLIHYLHDFLFFISNTSGVISVVSDSQCTRADGGTCCCRKNRGSGVCRFLFRHNH